MSNKSKMSKRKEETVNNCNCRVKQDCPLNGNCKTKDVIYQAEVKSGSSSETYIGLTSNEFKTRYNNHKSSFKNISKRYATELSKHVWDLKDQGRDYSITWKVICSATSYTNMTKKCNLCIAEKYYIICKPELASLNKRTELVRKCLHKQKFLLGNIT